VQKSGVVIEAFFSLGRCEHGLSFVQLSTLGLLFVQAVAFMLIDSFVYLFTGLIRRRIDAVQADL